MSLCSPVGGHLGCFSLLAVVNRAALDVSVRVSVCVPAFSSFVCVPRHGVAGS